MARVYCLRKIVLLSAASILFCFSTPTFAADAEVFNTEVRIILASNSDRGFDPRLLDLKNDLLALNYMSFQLLDQAGIALKRGEAGKLKVPGKRILELIPTDFDQRKISMQVLMTEKGSSLLNTRIRIENHGTVIIGGPPYEAGFLVLAVTVHFPRF
jgi:hypothetical protein